LAQLRNIHDDGRGATHIDDLEVDERIREIAETAVDSVSENAPHFLARA